MRRAAALFAMSLVLSWAPGAEAARGDARTEARNPAEASRPAVNRPAATRPAPTRTAPGQRAAAPISCVPYARQVTGMTVRGNGRDWWHNAAGQYARGQRPEPGSVLAFPASGNMRHGHVGVVSRVVSPRLIEMDHANWGGPGIRPGSVMRGVQVKDVSAANDWTRVRVQVGWTPGTFGRDFPTYGFIHNRPAGPEEVLMARARTQPQQTARANAPRPAANRPVQQASAAR